MLEVKLGSALNRRKVLLEAEDLVKEFPLANGKRGRQVVHAVSKVNLTIYEGETLALVGESGCGKSTLGRTLIRLLPATSGRLFFEGMEFSLMTEKEFAPYRRQMQLIFQDPYASLNPRMSVRQIIAEPLTTYGMAKDKQDLEEQVRELMKEVGIPTEFINRYPHQFSGGQRQRIGIARAIALRPKLIVCDEPVSALDVSVRAQVLNLIQELKKTKDLTYLFISHDLSVVKYVSDRIAVMYLGRVVEVAEKDELYQNPAHPYTKALLSAIPIPDVDNQMKREILTGDVPSPLNPPSGCYFHTRCKYATEKCRTECPRLQDIGGGHMAACHLCQGGKEG